MESSEVKEAISGGWISCIFEKIFIFKSVGGLGYKKRKLIYFCHLPPM